MREKLISGVEIERLEDVSSKNDERGPVFEWKNFTDKKTVQITGYIRQKGVVFGNHFHKGVDPSKNPELFLFVSGEAELWVWNKFSGEEAKIRLVPGTVIVISPGVFHKFTALSDIVNIEPRRTLFDRKDSDTFSAAEYETYQR